MANDRTGDVLTPPRDLVIPPTPLPGIDGYTLGAFGLAIPSPRTEPACVLKPDRDSVYKYTPRKPTRDRYTPEQLFYVISPW